MSYLAVVPALHIDDVWVQALPYFLDGAKYWKPFYSLDQILKNLIAGRQQLWIVVEGNQILGVVLTQLDEFPETKVFRILYLGGKGLYPGMMQFLIQMETWAKDKGAQYVDILGRDEWYRLIERFGYSSPGRVYRKELQP